MPSFFKQHVKSFSHAEMYLNCNFIFELATDTAGKATCSKCREYDYSGKSSDSTQQFNWQCVDFDQKKGCTEEPDGALQFVFFVCKKLLVPGMTLHLPLFRLPDYTLLCRHGTDDEAETLRAKYKPPSNWLRIVRKVVVPVSVKLSMGKALVKSAADYPHIESLNKSFILQVLCFVRENVFGE